MKKKNIEIQESKTWDFDFLHCLNSSASANNDNQSRVAWPCWCKSKQKFEAQPRGSDFAQDQDLKKRIKAPEHLGKSWYHEEKSSWE